MKKKFITLLLLTFMLPVSAKAASLEMNCNASSITVGDSVRCVITGKDSIVSGGSGVVSVTNGSITNREKLHCAAPSITDEFSCYDEFQEGKIDIVAYTFKSSSAGTMTITVSEATVLDADYNQVKQPNITKNITVNNPTTTTTTTTTTTKKIGLPIDPKKEEQQNSEPVTQNTEPTTEATTEAPVEDTTTTTQRVTPKTESNTQLTSLTIDGIEFEFKSDVLEYNIETTKDIKKLVFHYKTTNVNAIVTPSTTELKDGMNNVEIKVSYEGESTIYKLNINKKQSKSNALKIAKIVGSISGIIGLSYLLFVVIKK